MREITIKSYTRKGKNGKTYQVKGYTRRVGRKGMTSPKQEPGEEFAQKKESFKSIIEAPKPTAEEIAKRNRIYDERFSKAEEQRKIMNMTPEQYSSYITGAKLKQERFRAYLREQAREKAKRKAKKESVSSREIPTKKRQDFLTRVEDKIANFVEKYSGKKYKR